MEKESNTKGLSSNQKWVFTIVLNILLLLLGYKILFANYNLDLTKFSFSDFLALFLALFSIAISVAFYFKATDSSSRFYDNTYKFTKDIAELLVKIESGFGERLKHLDEGYSIIRDKFDKIPKTSIIEEKAQTQEELDKVKKEMEKILKEKESLLNETLQKAHSNESDRRVIINDLEQKELELELEKDKVDALERKLVVYDNLAKDIQKSIQVPPSLRNMWVHSIILTLYKKISSSDPYYELNDDFKKLVTGFPFESVLDLINYGIIDRDNNLTKNGVYYLKDLASNINE